MSFTPFAPRKFNIRLTSLADRDLISELIARQKYLIRHLDWRSPLEWLSHRPFPVLEDSGKPVAAMACIPEPASVAWVRFFCSTSGSDLDFIWKALLNNAVQDLSGRAVSQIACLGFYDWVVEMLDRSGFKHHQDIIMLEKMDDIPFHIKTNPEVRIQAVQQHELPTIALIDEKAFVPLWQNTLDGLKRAFKQASYFTLAMIGNEPVGYQLSTRIHETAHLARLAVLPAYQKNGIGTTILMDMIKYHQDRGIPTISLNTQSDNLASINIYKKMGFKLVEECVPVYVYAL